MNQPTAPNGPAAFCKTLAPDVPSGLPWTNPAVGRWSHLSLRSRPGKFPSKNRATVCLCIYIYICNSYNNNNNDNDNTIYIYIINYCYCYYVFLLFIVIIITILYCIIIICHYMKLSSMPLILAMIQAMIQCISTNRISNCWRRGINAGSHKPWHQPMCRKSAGNGSGWLRRRRGRLSG